MIKVEAIEVFGIEGAMRGMRNPLNSWDKADTTVSDDILEIGENDLNLATRLIKAGTEHRKFLRMIHVQMDVIAPLYWWKEADTYKVGTTTNSCSTMHKIAAKEFTLDDSPETIRYRQTKINPPLEFVHFFKWEDAADEAIKYVIDELI